LAREKGVRVYSTKYDDFWFAPPHLGPLPLAEGRGEISEQRIEIDSLFDKIAQR
jgi:hypothetical protein